MKLLNLYSKTCKSLINFNYHPICLEKCKASLSSFFHSFTLSKTAICNWISACKHVDSLLHAYWWTATAYFWWMLWNANELTKISGDFEKKLFMMKIGNWVSLPHKAIMPPRSLTLLAGATTNKQPWGSNCSLNIHETEKCKFKCLSYAMNN